ncbi:MAG: DUF4097 domain-containing protein [Candidatus Thermoplasmatota archaeon]|nr:DUF4097 domain-containing protein [Candidatus Thermoplasmatota archaeon]
MKWFCIVCIYGVLLSTWFAGCTVPVGPEVTDIFSDTRSISNETQLYVENYNGKIEIIGYSEDDLEITAVKRTRYGRDELDLVNISIDEQVDRIKIETVYDTPTRSRVSVDYNIKMPSSMLVASISTSNGAITIEDARGDADVSTSNGMIVITGVDGYVSASTSNGRIEVTDTYGIDEIETSNGLLFIEVWSVRDDVNIHTSNGGITIYLNESLDVTLDASTSNGAVTNHDLTINATSSSRTTYRGVLGIGTYELSVRTTNGHIDLYGLN